MKPTSVLILHFFVCLLFFVKEEAFSWHFVCVCVFVYKRLIDHTVFLSNVGLILAPNPIDVSSGGGGGEEKNLYERLLKDGVHVSAGSVYVYDNYVTGIIFFLEDMMC